MMRKRVSAVSRAATWRRAVTAAVVALSLVVAACGGSDGGPTVRDLTATPSPTPSPSPTDKPLAEPTLAAEETAEPVDLAAYLSERTMEMWEVYNAYDVDGLRAFYEESYWQAEEKELRSNIQPFKARGTTFEAEETSPPTEIEPGRWEVRHTARFPGGSVKMVFIYEQFDGEWLFTYAEVG